MWGAVIGDIAGSIYEYNQTQKVSSINITNILPTNGFYSDDTILTIAIIDAILNNKNYEYYLKKYVRDNIDYKPNFNPYFKSSFSPNFIKWVAGNNNSFSKGNGALMRISPVGYLFKTKEEIIRNTHLVTSPSHNTREAIESATLVALIIYYAKKGLNKEEIINKLKIKVQYKEFNKFNTTCKETLSNCLYALFTSDSYEESIKKVISYGGDTDTNACIVGSMSEALYGLNNDLIERAETYLPIEYTKKLKLAYNKIRNT